MVALSWLNDSATIIGANPGGKDECHRQLADVFHFQNHPRAPRRQIGQPTLGHVTLSPWAARPGAERAAGPDRDA